MEPDARRDRDVGDVPRPDRPLLVNLDDGTTKRLTDDAADQLTPRFYPDGKQIVFVYYPEVTIPVPANFDAAKAGLC